MIFIKKNIDLLDSDRRILEECIEYLEVEATNLERFHVVAEDYQEENEEL